MTLETDTGFADAPPRRPREEAIADERAVQEAFRPTGADVLPRRPPQERVNGVVKQMIEGYLRDELRNLKPGDSIAIFREKNDDRPEFTVTVREHGERPQEVFGPGVRS